MNVEISARALAELDAAFAFLNQDNPRAADAMRAAIAKAISSLETLPNRGRPGRVSDTRELLVKGAPYVVVYGVNSEVVNIFNIRHTSQNPII